MYIFYLLPDRWTFLRLLDDPVYPGLMVTDCALYLLLVLKTLHIVVCASANPQGCLDLPVAGILHRNRQAGKIHIKNIRVIRIKGVPRRPHGL